jgi:hypothetical protein
MDLLDLWCEMPSDPTRSPEERAMIEATIRDVARDALAAGIACRRLAQLSATSVSS